jgi:hypothetical protein
VLRSRRPAAGLGPGWVCTATRSPEGARLTVHHRAGDDRWIDLATRYWDGALPGIARIKSSRFAIVDAGRVPPDDQPCFFKRFLFRDAADWWKHWVRASRARRALLRGEEIRRLGFVAPEPLCLIEEQRAAGPGLTALVTVAIQGARSMREWIHEPAASTPRALARRRELLRAFGRAIGAWHAAGLYHGDLSPRNVLCRCRDDRVELFWLDNEGVRRFGCLPMRLRLRNLAQVNNRLKELTGTDRLRLARGYFEEAGLSPAVRRDVLRDLAERRRRRFESAR